MVSVVAVAVPSVSAVAGMPTVCFVIGVVLTFVPMAVMIMGIVVMTGVMAVMAVLWALSHTVFSWRAGGAGTAVRGSAQLRTAV